MSGSGVKAGSSSSCAGMRGAAGSARAQARSSATQRGSRSAVRRRKATAGYRKRSLRRGGFGGGHAAPARSAFVLAGGQAATGAAQHFREAEGDSTMVTCVERGLGGGIASGAGGWRRGLRRRGQPVLVVVEAGLGSAARIGGAGETSGMSKSSSGSGRASRIGLAARGAEVGGRRSRPPSSRSSTVFSSALKGWKQCPQRTSPPRA